MTPHVLLTGEAGHGKDTICDRLISHHGYARVGFADGVKDEIGDRFKASPLLIDRDYLNRRDTKELPQNALALIYCSDNAYVQVALTAFEAEDQQLFEQFKKQIGPLLLQKSPWKEALPEDERQFRYAARMMLPRSPRRIAQVYGTEYRRAEPNGHLSYWIDRLQGELAKTPQQKAIGDGRFPNEVDLAAKINIPRIHVVRPGFGDLNGSQAAAHASEKIPPADANTIVLINDGDLAWINAKVDNVMKLLSEQVPYPQIAQTMENWVPESAMRKSLRATA